MRTIFKYKLLGPQTTVNMPEGAVPLHVDNQHGDVCVWFEVDTTKPTKDIILYSVGTGWAVPEFAKYIGTVLLGEFVWHVYGAA